MIKPITLYGSEDLEVKSVDIDTEKRKELLDLISDMFETMHKAGGIGLAAIQVGVPVNLFVIEAHMEDEDFHLREVFINPKVIRIFGEMVKHPEGCLSVPGLTGFVERPDSIELEWIDSNFDKQTKIFDGYAARIIQHEYDHLIGELYVDKLEKLWESIIARPLELIKDRKMEVPYLWR